MSSQRPSQRPTAPSKEDPGKCTHPTAMVMRPLAPAIVDDVPRPGTVWRWSDTELTHSQLSTLKAEDLIVQVDRDERLWRSRPRLPAVVARYASTQIDEEEVGTAVGQTALGDLPTSD